jgi:DNA-binding GntR family transcriptional regulator
MVSMPQDRRLTTPAAKKQAALTLPPPAESARSRIYNYIHDLVTSGALPGGHVISELQVSRILGTSRSPVREAVANLIADGLLKQAPNRSAVVVDLSREDIVDLYEVREALEVFAVRKVAQRGLHPENHKQLLDYLDSFQLIIRTLKASGKRMLSEEQMAEFSALDMKLHALLVLSTQNVRMQKVVSDTRVLVRVFAMRRNGHEISMLEKIQRQHVAIVQAVARGRAEEAAALLSEHIQTSLKERLEEFDLWKRDNALRDQPVDATLPGRLRKR